MLDITMSNKVIGGIVVAVIMAVAGFFLIYNNRSYSSPAQPQSNPPGSQNPTQETIQPSAPANETTAEQNVITLTQNGFSPPTVTVKTGSKITWVNKSGKEWQIGADPHPSHTGNRQISGGEFTLNLAPGQERVVTGEKVGTFGYHNHLNPSQTGTIIVQ